MLKLSKFFKNDTLGDSQTLKPIISITDPQTNNVLFTLTQDKDEILDNNGDKLDIISNISKVSNVRLSTDYDSKKLKINRLRCTLYNYYDVNTKLSEYINNSITNKNLFLFYKSPTTNVLNTTADIGDYDCAMVYKGEISRVEFNSDTLTILAEDKTQLKISNKKVPYMSTERLDDVIKNNLTPKYKKDDVVVPMTFGKVDKAPTISYYAPNTEREMTILFDVFPTHKQYKTAKIPSLLTGHIFNNTNYNYFLYVKDGDDYITLDHSLYTNIRQYEHYSRVVLDSRSFSGNYMFPELAGALEQGNFKNWDMKGFFQRQCESAYGASGSILDAAEIQSESQDDTTFNNFNSLIDNGGKIKRWYREGDSIQPSVSDFDTGFRYFHTDYTGKGAGRWIILKLEPAPSNSLVNIKYEGQWRGNTFLLADWSLRFQDNNNAFPNEYEKIGFFVAPIPLNVWSQFNLETLTYTAVLNEFLDAFLANTDQQLEESADVIDGFNPYTEAPIYVNVDETEKNNGTYFGETSNISSQTEWNNINGLYYGDKGSFDRVTVGSADAHDLLAIFEFHPDFVEEYYWATSLTMNNTALLHSVLVEKISDKQIYASIEGRKNHLYTEQLDPDTYTQEIEYNLSFESYISGTIDDAVLLDNFYNTISNIFNETMEDGSETEYFVGYTSGSNTTDPEWDSKEENFQYNGSYITALNNNFIGFFIGNDSEEFPPIVKDANTFILIFEAYLKLYRLFRRFRNLESGVQGGYSYTFNLTGATNNRLKSTNNIGQIFKNEFFVKSFGKCIYEYLLQRPIDYDLNFEIDLRIPTSGGWYQDAGIYFNGWTNYNLNFTDFITSNRLYQDNYSMDSNVTNLDTLFENFYAYIDDLTNTINTAFLEDGLQDTMNLCRFIEWNSTASQYGSGGWWSASNINSIGSLYDGIGNDPDADSILLQLQSDLTNYVISVADEDTFEEIGAEGTTTNGIIEKPSDVVMNILSNELGYGKHYEDQELGDIIAPNYNDYDIPSIEQSRLIHTSWKMGFSLNKKIDGKKLIEEILNESQSYPRFNNDGKFGLINIKNSYTRDDINKTINTNEILSYKFSETKREDIINSCTMFYRYDYGHRNYTLSKTKNIIELLPDYNNEQLNNYHLEDTDGHKDINLKYHSDSTTVDYFLDYKLLNQCNTHNLCDMKLSLNHMDLTVGDIIHIPLINNEKIFNIDYSIVDYKNTQPIYPLWIIMETNIGITDVSIKAYQLHYLGTDGVHGFV